MSLNNNKPRSDKEAAKLEQFKVGNKLSEFIAHTNRLLNKEKLFPKKSRWQWADSIFKTGDMLLGAVSYANGIKPVTPALALKRYEAQIDAAGTLNAYYKRVEQAQYEYQLPPDELSSWTREYNEFKDMLSKWSANDFVRYRINDMINIVYPNR